ncbi:alpha/beta fold hydrolase [Amycolatopsis panacis]|uniref:Alpha/beta fold hydrolase n=1 Tax=Amycolatopsis panacis TaxID=2340917 RepID=A0A419HSS4_9PSEU|nr:alpha/beta fold hydrolase [Amycolatopsis panacis]RJQ79653.1 alpha/beta fold hydrolase [Amycolatopsis panacis]
MTRVPLSTTPLPPLDPALPPWPGGLERDGGTTLHVRRTPGMDGSTAVYVHGLGGSSTNWTDLAALLSPAAAGRALDLPGFGFSEPEPDFGFRLADHAEVVARYVAGLGAGPVHLLGNSMGGAIAMMVAARRPELVKTLTLISPAMPDRRPDPRRLSDPLMALAYLPVVGAGVRRRMAGLTARERAAQVIALCFDDPARFPEQRLDELTVEHSARAGFAWAAQAMERSTFGIFRQWTAFGEDSLWSIATRVRVPSLVIWGLHDRVISVRRAERTARLLPNARLLVLPRTGHVAQMERPNVVARAVLGLWEGAGQGDW